MTTNAPTTPMMPDAHQFWWTTPSGDTSFLTYGSSTFAATGGSTFLSASSGPDPSWTPVPNSSPTTTSSASGTTIAWAPAASTFPTTSFPPAFTSSTVQTATPTQQVAANSGPVCIGDGIDASAGGILATLIVPSAIGLLIWLLFAFLRPRYRQVYGAREWFVQQDLRPKPLHNTFWAFLNPPVPLVPDVPADVSDAGKTSPGDAQLFPSDEQLSQRTLWTSLLVVLGWSFLALVGALPLYLVRTRCLATSAPHPTYNGMYSTLQDLSLLRLLQLLDNEDDRVLAALVRRDTSDGLSNARIRLIILSAFVIVLAVFPAVFKLLHEFSRIAAFRRRWIDFRCEGKEMGWLSARKAPGFAGKGEKQLKEFVLRTGLSASLDINGGNSTRTGNQRRQTADNLSHAEEERLDVDIQSLFTIGDTQHLAALIDERDVILDNLEVAEARYISSFRMLTPDPSIADFLQEQPNPNMPQISRPRPLTGASTTRRRSGRARNPAHGSSSYAPSAYMLPSTYYRLRRIQGISSSFSVSNGALNPEPTLSDSINQRVVGSRFQEVHNRSSAMFGKLPLGSRVRVDKEGILNPVPAEPIPDPLRYGPNHGVGMSAQVHEHERVDSGETRVAPEDDWVDLTREQNAENSVYATPTEGPSSFYPPEAENGADELGTLPAPRRLPLIWNYPASHRSTFPMRPTRYSALAPSEVPPPHLRLQSRGPFFRPMSGLGHQDLGEVYADISHWRSQLKAINAQITAAQNDAYSDIAEGTRIKGWLLVGRGIRFIPGIQMIEGRAKEDVRWHELQHEGGASNRVILVAICIVTAIALACSLLAVAGLALGTAPNFTHYLGFLSPLTNRNDWISGLATGLAAAVAATLFIAITVAILHYATRLSTAVSISALELTSFKITFWVITLIGFLMLTAIGSILFAIGAFSRSTQRSATVANGSVYMSALMLAIVINLAIIAPGLLVLQPLRLWRTTRAERNAVTPRHRFRAVYPASYNPTFAMGCCILAVAIASTFTLLFPLIGPAVVLLVLLTLVAHRFLVGYVYARTHSQTGGLLQLWLLRRFATLTALQPLVLGLILLTRRLWEEGGVLCGTALLIVVFVEIFCARKLREPGRKSLSPITRNSLDTFARAARVHGARGGDEESTDLVSESLATAHRTRGSFASVLEMMSATLAVQPSQAAKGPVPLPTETLDDLTATERAARTHPDAPPHLPNLSFADHADEISGILYAPELVAPAPTIWLPNDSAGVARGEALDLQKYHGLRATLDVHSREDAMGLGANDRRQRSSDPETEGQADTRRTRGAHR